MSDSWIIIIPNDPQFVPTMESQKGAEEYMRRIAGNADAVSMEATEDVRFIHCGENLESINCPHCANEISTDWWQDQMDYQFEHAYTLDPIPLPCCGRLESLARLNYNWPQGYARFSVEAMNPDVPDLTETQVGEFENLLGCRVLKILQRI